AGLSENGATEPRKQLTVFWGVATGAVAAVMLVAGGDHPAAALNGLKHITIVSAVPCVLVMLVLGVALWKGLANGAMVWRGKLARHVLVVSGSCAVEEHGGAFELSTLGPEDSENGTTDRLTRRRRLLFGMGKRKPAHE